MITLYIGGKAQQYPTTANSYHEESVGAVPKLVIETASATPLTFPQGMRCTFRGEDYYLFTAPEVTKQSRDEYRYVLTLHGEAQRLRLTKFKFIVDNPKDVRLKFALSGSPRFFLEQIVRNMGAGWSVGSVLDAPAQVLSFSHEDCLGALARLAEAFNTEWHVTGKTIHLGKVEDTKTTPLTLAYGKGKGLLPGLKVEKSGDDAPVGKLYVQGGDRNIDPSKYGSRTLHLPKNASKIYQGRTYRTDAKGEYITITGVSMDGRAEDSFDGSSVYPQRVGTLSSVLQTPSGNYDVYDKDSPVDYSQWQVAGEKAYITFQTGRLAGRSFDIATDGDKLQYDKYTGRFQLVSVEEDGLKLPEPKTFYPERGDKYAVFGVTLPTSYITEAENALFDNAVRYLHEALQPKVSYRAELDGIFSAKDWANIGGKLRLGYYVRLVDKELGIDDKVRITAIRTPLGREKSPQITLSNNLQLPSFGATLGKLEAEEVRRADETKSQVRKASAQTLQQALTAAEAVAKTAAGEFANSINPATIHTLQTTVGSTERQFRLYLAGSTQETTLEPSYSYGVLEIGQALDLRHQSLGNTNHTLSPSETTKGMSQWRLQPFRSGYIGDEEKPLYLYAVCSTYNSSAEWRLEKEPHELESEAGRYWLLAGLVQAKPDYSFTRLYGFTSITPGQVRVDRIVSADGNSYFDLVSGVIAGKFKFILPNGGVSDKPDNIIADILAEAKGYSDSTTGKTLKDARAYADSKDKDSRSYTDKALKDARGYADERQLEAQYNANSYTDEKSREAMGFAEQGNREARAYTDTKSQEGKTYTDQKSKEGKDYTDAKDKAARAYTDERIKAIEHNKNITDYLRKAIQDGSTDIYGGLILTNFLAARDPETKQIRSFIAGSQDNKLPAFAAGVTNFGRDTYDAKVRIEHDGRAVFNSMYINDSGYYGDCVIFRNPGFKTNKDVQAILLRIGGDFLPDPKDLAKKGKGWDRNENIGELTQKVRRRIAVLSMPEEYTGARWTITISLSFLFNRDKEEKINSMLKPIRVKAYFGNTLIGTSESYQLYGTGGNGGIPIIPGNNGGSALPNFKAVQVKMRDIVWNSRYNGEADNLRLELDTENTYDFEISCGVRVQASVGENANRGMVIADNGFTAYGDPKRWFQMKVTGNNTPTLRMRGEADIPGLLFAVRVSNGSIVKRWGYYANDVTMRAGYGSDWVFTHNLGHNNYICTAHVLSHDHASVSLKEESANTITLYVTDNGRGNRSIAFTLMVFGEGKAMG